MFCQTLRLPRKGDGRFWRHIECIEVDSIMANSIGSLDRSASSSEGRAAVARFVLFQAFRKKKTKLAKAGGWRP